MPMETTTITFLGTGNAVPTKLRNHAAIFVEFLHEHILVDCGEGTQRQFRIAELSPAKLTRLLVTHWHGDHVLGIPGLFQTLAMSDYARTLDIHGPKGTHRALSLIEELFHDFKIATHVSEREGVIVDTPLYALEARAMPHGPPTYAYALTLKDKLRLDKAKLKKLRLPNTPLLGELQAGKDIVVNGKKIRSRDVSYIEKGRRIVIILDTGMTDAAIEFARNADLLICESTFSAEEQDKAREYRHLTAADAATIAKKAKAKSLILTHISQRYEHNLSVIEKEARKIFRNTRIVKDFDVVIV